MAKILEQEGGLTFTKAQADRLTGEALRYLEQASPEGEAGAALQELADKLLHRQN
jgi:geranylgeranyl pyrophosphate synthase